MGGLNYRGCVGRRVDKANYILTIRRGGRRKKQTDILEGKGRDTDRQADRQMGRDSKKATYNYNSSAKVIFVAPMGAAPNELHIRPSRLLVIQNIRGFAAGKPARPTFSISCGSST